MATTPRPTKTQLRQHALDRAIQPDIVQKLPTWMTGKDPEGNVRNPAAQTARDITTIAEHFAEWLGGAEEPEPPKANLGLASTEELLRELEERGRFLETLLNSSEKAQARDQEQGRLLAAYTVDVSNRLTPETLAYRTVQKGHEELRESYKAATSTTEAINEAITG